MNKMTREIQRAGVHGLELTIRGASVQSVEVKGGRLVYEDSGGEGEVVLCLPSLGDVRQEYRFLAPQLVEAGYRVLVADLRGFGESSASFSSYLVEDLGHDILAVLDHVGVERAHLVGCSISAAAIGWVAVEAPERVNRLVMLGAIVRDLPADKFFRPLSHVLFFPLWGVVMWGMYVKTLFPQAPPSDFPSYVQSLKANLREPGRLKALGKMMRGSKASTFARFPQVKADAFVVIGSKDPDFSDASAEPELIREALGGSVETYLAEGLGHYPHVEAPEEMGGRIVRFLSQG